MSQIQTYQIYYTNKKSPRKRWNSPKNSRRNLGFRKGDTSQFYGSIGNLIYDLVDDNASDPLERFRLDSGVKIICSIGEF